MSISKPLEEGKTYKMTDWRVEEMRSGYSDFLTHVHACGNRFVVVKELRSSYQMKCLGCDNQYQTVSPRFYEPVDNLLANNPNVLFRKQLKNCGRRKS